MNTWEEFKNKLQDLSVSKSAAEMLVQAFRDGGVEVSTPLDLKSGEQYTFRTLIQLDADVINYIPKIDDTLIQLNLSQIKRTLRKHWYEVEFVFFKLKTNDQFWNALSDVALVIINSVSIFLSIDFNSLLQSVISIVIASGSVYFRKKIQEFVSPYLVRGGFKVYKWLEPFLKKKVGKMLF